MSLLRTVENVQIVGLDNMNDYYDVSIKQWRLKEIETLAARKVDSQWTFIRGSIADRALVDDCFETYVIVLFSSHFFRSSLW